MSLLGRKLINNLEGSLTNFFGALRIGIDWAKQTFSLFSDIVYVSQSLYFPILSSSWEETLEKEINILAKNDVCEIANDNCDGQIVVSGKKKIIEILSENLKKKKKRGILLPVSAPFHCSLMKNASKAMEEKIKSTNFQKPKPSIISNVTAKEESDVNMIKELLINQITSRVRWRESVNYMLNNGVKEFVEIGPGKVLSSLVKKINKDVKSSNINTIENIKNDSI